MLRIGRCSQHLLLPITKHMAILTGIRHFNWSDSKSLTYQDILLGSC